jgi:hypothetical protein
MTTKSKSSPTTNRISNFMFMIVLVVMALSIVALGLAATNWIGGNELEAMYFVGVGAVALIMSTYFLLQTRRTASTAKMAVPSKVMTTVECRKCGVKTLRDFQRGDYVYKELEACQKCPDDKTIITSIYKEVTEKEKVYKF